MGDVVIEHPGTPCCEALNLQNVTRSENDADLVQSFHGAYLPEDGTREKNSTCTEALDRGYLEYGCSHYRRRCRIRAPCCNEVFDCRHCHNEEQSMLTRNYDMRFLVTRWKGLYAHFVVLNKRFGKFASIVVCAWGDIFAKPISKRPYHCNGCGICRIGGMENFFHCPKCRCCYSVLLKNSHPCVEGAMHHDCPVCFEYLFESVNDVTVMLCGHTIYKKLLEGDARTLPICLSSLL